VQVQQSFNYIREVIKQRAKTNRTILGEKRGSSVLPRVRTMAFGLTGKVRAVHSLSAAKKGPEIGSEGGEATKEKRRNRVLKRSPTGRGGVCRT